MDTISYSDFRGHMAHVLDQVNEDHKPVIITRQKGKPAVVMSLEDFKSYEESVYLVRSPKNVERLNRSIEQLESGKGLRKKLIEDKE
ncbi:MAG: type II toxin-antitoxin system prevent-host-death family antitoxin [Legionellales bacterium]